MTIKPPPPFRDAILSMYGNVPILRAFPEPHRPSDNVIRMPIKPPLRVVPTERTKKESA